MKRFQHVRRLVAKPDERAHLVRLQNTPHCPLVRLGQRHRAIDRNASRRLLLEHDIGRLPVQSDPNLFEFVLELLSLFVPLCDVQHDADEVGGFGDGDDLATSASTACSSFNDSGQIEDCARWEAYGQRMRTVSFAHEDRDGDGFSRESSR